MQGWELLFRAKADTPSKQKSLEESPVHVTKQVIAIQVGEFVLACIVHYNYNMTSEVLDIPSLKIRSGTKYRASPRAYAHFQPCSYPGHGIP
jgi:hypothetical protein